MPCGLKPSKINVDNKSDPRRYDEAEALTQKIDIFDFVFIQTHLGSVQLLLGAVSCSGCSQPVAAVGDP